MRVLVYGINFAPEPTSTGKYSGEMAEWLAARGHDVRVVTAPPYYPGWRVKSPYRAWRYQREELGAMHVWRCPLWVPRRPRGLSRVLHLLSFALTSAPVVLGQALWRPRSVVVVAPTLLCAPVGWLLACLGGGRAWLHVQDFELDAAYGTGLVGGGWLKRLAAAWERWCLRRFDRVSTISSVMMASLTDKGVASERCVIFPNWADINDIFPLERESELRRELELEPGVRVALYAGNMGEKQGLELLLDAAGKLAGRSDLVFVLAGEGAARPRIEGQAQGLTNVRWLPVQPAGRLNELLNLADVHLLPQRADVAGAVMPSKLTNILASGRPVVATACAGTAIYSVVAAQETGLAVEPGDGAAFAQAIERLASDADERGRLGRNGRIYAEHCLHKDGILERFERDLVDCVYG